MTWLMILIIAPRHLRCVRAPTANHKVSIAASSGLTFSGNGYRSPAKGPEPFRWPCCGQSSSREAGRPRKCRDISAAEIGSLGDDNRFRFTTLNDLPSAGRPLDSSWGRTSPMSPTEPEALRTGRKGKRPRLNWHVRCVRPVDREPLDDHSCELSLHARHGRLRRKR